MPLPTRELQFDANLYAFGGAALDTTLGESLSATIEDPRLRPTQLLNEFGQEQRAGGMAQRGVRGQLLSQPEQQEMMTPEQVTNEFGSLGVKYDKPTPRRVVEMTADRRRADMHRNEIIAASPQDIGSKLARFGAAAAGGIIDPLNIASAFIPVFGEANFARIAATTGVVGAHVAESAAANFVGSVALEAPTYALSRQLELDYSMSDALFNVGLGTMLGGGIGLLHGVVAPRVPAEAPKTIGERVQDRVQAMPVPEIVTNASREAKEGAARGAIAQMIDGREVDVKPILDVDESIRGGVPHPVYGPDEFDSLRQPGPAIAPRERPVPTPERQAAAVAEHRAAINGLADHSSSWEKNVPPKSEVEPLKQYTEKEAEELATEAVDQIEKEMIAAREVGGEPTEAPPPAAIQRADEIVAKARGWEPAIRALGLCMSRNG